MIDLNFRISNPWSTRFRNICIKSGPGFIKNKYWEFNIHKSSDIISVSVSITTKRDHSGVYLSAGLFGYNVEFNFYDTRHWDYKRNRWHYY